MTQRPGRTSVRPRMGEGGRILTSLVIATCAHDAVADCEYELTLIVVPPCSTHTESIAPSDISENGFVVGGWGDCPPGAPRIPFLWRPDTGFTFIPPPSGMSADADAEGVNSAGVVVGFGNTSLGRRGFIYRDGVSTIPPLFPDEAQWWFNQIEDDGTVIGGCNPTSAPYDEFAFVWSDEEGVRVIPTPKGIAANPTDIIPGRTVAITLGYWNSYVGCLWSEGGRVEMLPTVEGWHNFFVNGVNALGWASGGALLDEPIDGVTSSVTLFRNGSWEFLGLLPGDVAGGGGQVNGRGEIVGISSGPGGTRGFHWANGQMRVARDLAPAEAGVLGIGRLSAINERGQFVSAGTDPGGKKMIIFTPKDRSIADLNADCRVDGIDLLLLLQQWSRPRVPADFDGDGAVSFDDLLTLLAEWTN